MILVWNCSLILLATLEGCSFLACPFYIFTSSSGIPVLWNNHTWHSFQVQHRSKKKAVHFFCFRAFHNCSKLIRNLTCHSTITYIGLCSQMFLHACMDVLKVAVSIHKENQRENLNVRKIAVKYCFCYAIILSLWPPSTDHGYCSQEKQYKHLIIYSLR